MRQADTTYSFAFALEDNLKLIFLNFNKQKNISKVKSIFFRFYGKTIKYLGNFLM